MAWLVPAASAPLVRAPLEPGRTLAALCQAPRPGGCSSLSWQLQALLCLVNVLGWTPWSSAGSLSWAAFLLLLLLPSHVSASAALAQWAPGQRRLAKHWQISPGSGHTMGHNCDMFLSWSSSPLSPCSESHCQPIC